LALFGRLLRIFPGLFGFCAAVVFGQVCSPRNSILGGTVYKLGQVIKESVRTRPASELNANR